MKEHGDGMIAADGVVVLVEVFLEGHRVKRLDEVHSLSSE